MFKKSASSPFGPTFGCFSSKAPAFPVVVNFNQGSSCRNFSHHDLICLDDLPKNAEEYPKFAI
jgi:hypothetical protein